MNVHRRAFTLIELLVVVGIIALLAGLLFPVFNQARIKARQANDYSNLKQIITAWGVYSQDYDEMVCPSGWIGGYSDQEDRRYHSYWYGGFDYSAPPGTWHLDPKGGLLYPYLKDHRVFDDLAVNIDQDSGWPGVAYGYNICYLGGYGDVFWAYGKTPLPQYHEGPVAVAAITAASDTVAFTDCAWYDKPNQQFARVFTAVPPSVEAAWAGPAFHARFSGFGNVAFTDGHVQAMRPRYFEYTTWDGNAYPAREARERALGSIDRDGDPMTDEFWNCTGQP